eukprot:968169_1
MKASVCPDIHKKHYSPLHQIPLAVLAGIFEDSLKRRFENVEVDVRECPDLTTWGLAAPGICGSPRMVDVGGEPFLYNPTKRHKRFDLSDVVRNAELEKGFIFGPAATSSVSLGCNAELMVNQNFRDGINKSVYAKVGEEQECCCGAYQSTEIGVLGNLILCEGEIGQTVHVRVSKWKGDPPGDGGDRNFVSVLRKGLMGKSDGGNQIGIGGVFRVAKGQVRSHVMPDFPEYHLSPELCRDWLEFYSMGPDLTCLCYFITGDPMGGAMNLRTEHTHFFSSNVTEGGHFHHNVTPDEISYEGYFVVCEKISRLANAFTEE